MRHPYRPPKEPRQQAAVWAVFGVLVALTVAVAGLSLLQGQYSRQSMTTARSSSARVGT